VHINGSSRGAVGAVAISWRTYARERLEIALRQAQDRLRRSAPRNDIIGILAIIATSTYEAKQCNE
jgi:hypothetical protein